MKRFLTVILNPFLLSLWATLLILLFFPVRIDKYTATLLESGVNLNKRMVCYDDLDNDGNSEEIAIFHNSLGTAGLTIANLTGVLDQWTFHGNLDFSMPNGIVITGDRDNDGLRETYVFTLSGDSLFLNVIPDFREPGVTTRKRFVARIGNRGGKADPYMVPAEMQDLTGDGIKELVFGIGTGYSLYPRRVFGWDAIRDTFLESPESGYFIKGILQADVNEDHINEIIPYGYAAANISGSSVPYPDTCSWLMVMNQQLHFTFDPVNFNGTYSGLTPVILHDNSGRHVLAALHNLPDHTGNANFLMRIGKEGNIEKSVEVDKNSDLLLNLKDIDNKEWLLLPIEGTGFELYNAALSKRRFVPANISGNALLVDVDMDGLKEVMTVDLYKRQLVIFRNNLDHPVILTIKGQGEGGILYSIKKQTNRDPQFFVQMGDNFFLYEYGFNAAYNLRVLIYASIYLSILLFSFLVRKIQQNQLHIKQDTTRKITEMQLKLIRNQLDPHFIMNAINSIMAGITDNNPDEARNQLMHFSRLHRSLLLSSTQIHRTIQEEITFTGDYLALEKLRFSDKFDYSINVDPEVDTSVNVPKMILQIHVENALKHGIMPLSRKGRLTVDIKSGSGSLVLEVTDNGVGREYARNHQDNSTGKGLQVMDQYIELYNSQHKNKIQSIVQDMFDDRGNPDGTKIIIDIAIAHENQ